jgi:hypothetical protein
MGQVLGKRRLRRKPRLIFSVIRKVRVQDLERNRSIQLEVTSLENEDEEPPDPVKPIRKRPASRAAGLRARRVRIERTVHRELLEPSVGIISPRTEAYKGNETASSIEDRRSRSVDFSLTRASVRQFKSNGARHVKAARSWSGADLNFHLPSTD